MKCLHCKGSCISGPFDECQYCGGTGKEKKADLKKGDIVMIMDPRNSWWSKEKYEQAYGVLGEVDGFLHNLVWVKHKFMNSWHGIGAYVYKKEALEKIDAMNVLGDK